MRIFWLVLGLLLVSACDDSARDVIKEPVDEPIAYVPPSGGLLSNPQFELTEHGVLADWKLLQHTGPKSYQLNVGDGVASITRIDQEPWGTLVQVFRGQRALALQGHLVEFSAEVAGEFTDAYGAPISPAGLNVTIRGLPKGANPFLGASILFNEVVPVVPTVGAMPWQRYALQFEVPAVAEVSSVEIDLSFTMTYGGTMKIRGPSFTLVE